MSQGAPLVDTTGDQRPALEVRLEYALVPFDDLAETARRRLGKEPPCACGHAASSHYDHADHGACPCEGYMPVPVGRCRCGHLKTSHSGRCLARHHQNRHRVCACTTYHSQED